MKAGVDVQASGVEVVGVAVGSEDRVQSCHHLRRFRRLPRLASASSVKTGRLHARPAQSNRTEPNDTGYAGTET